LKEIASAPFEMLGKRKLDELRKELSDLKNV
jgi:hypothetical protein